MIKFHTSLLHWCTWNKVSISFNWQKCHCSNVVCADCLTKVCWEAGFPNSFWKIRHLVFHFYGLYLLKRGNPYCETDMSRAYFFIMILLNTDLHFILHFSLYKSTCNMYFNMLSLDTHFKQLYVLILNDRVTLILKFLSYLLSDWVGWYIAR